jgi:hypothetical protein
MSQNRLDELWPEPETNSEEEDLTLEQRIEAFYRQSGGPNNPDVPRILNNHLLYSKDHGRHGYRQTVEDAVIDTVLGDPTLLLLFQRVQQWRNRKQQAAQGTAGASPCVQDDIRRLQSDVAALREEIASLKVLLGDLTHQTADKA